MSCPIRRPVRVNPVLLHAGELRQSLNGYWRFRLDPHDCGLERQWQRGGADFEAEVQVPGSWQGQGFGSDSHDTVWDFRFSTRVFRATYKGTGWYAREFIPPTAWQGQRVWLNFGGAHPSAEVWLNGIHLGQNDLPFVPFGFDITNIVRFDGPNDLVVRVHGHHREFGLAYNWQGNWSGLYRGVELTTTGPCWLERCLIHPDVESGSIDLSVQVGGEWQGEPLTLRISAGLAGKSSDSTAERSLDVKVSESQAKVAVPITSPRLWSPDEPNLYRLDVALCEGDVVHDALSERTGFVHLSTRGKHFLINGEPYFLRGTGDFVSCPETGCPDVDRERWRRKLHTLRAYGYNYVRCQSYVYPPEYFDAADEAGLLVQSEMGMLGGWGGHSADHVYQWPKPTPDNYPILKKQWDLVVLRDVHHPSANLYCMSNEYYSSTDFPRIAWQCHRDTKALKPTAMVLWTDGGYNKDMPGDFVNHAPEKDKEIDAPVVVHEFQWWSSYPDVRIEHKYSGAVRPYAAELARAAARRHALEHLLPAFAAASQRVQLLEAKAKMEMCRRDHPTIAGICHFNAMDANPSPQGVIDEFYEHKLATAEEWLRANGDTVVLSSLTFDDRVLLCGETLSCRLFVSDFSHPSMKNPALRWRLEAWDWSAAGSLSWQHVPFRTCEAGQVEVRAPALKSPRRATLEAEVVEGGRRFRNAWPLWIFPEPPPWPAAVAVYGEARYTWLGKLAGTKSVGHGDLSSASIVLTERIDEALAEFLSRGGRVILAASEGLVRPHPPNFGFVKYFFTPPANYPPYEDGQNGTLIQEHPMLGDFPHEGFADLQFFRMVDNSPPIDLAPLFLADGEPVIRVIHRYPVCRPLGYLVERRVDAGMLIVSALDLDPAFAEARYLLSTILKYAADSRRQASQALPPTALARLIEATEIP